MPEQPRDALTNVLGEMADRAGRYAAIWQDAAARNASGEYNADAAIADFQQAYTMALRDMAEMGAAMIESFAAVMTPVATPARAEAKERVVAQKAAPRKAPAKKQAPAKKTPPRKRGN